MNCFPVKVFYSEMFNILVQITFYISIIHESYGVTVEKAGSAPLESTNPTLANEQALIQPFGRPDPDEAASCGQLIESRGFGYERYYVTTADGYILQNFRIINPYAKKARKTLKPVLLVHGLPSTCSSWLFNSPYGHIKPWINGNPTNDTSGALGFLLANLGYDVWLINARGTSYSTNHTHFDASKDIDFWDYSFYEIAIYDVTATVESIKQETGLDKIVVIAHSQGTIQMIVQLSVLPEFEENYDLVILAAPIGFLGDVQGFFGASINNMFTRMLMSLNNVPSSDLLFGALAVFCRNKLAIPICESIPNGFAGFDAKQENTTRANVYISLLDRTSNKNLIHLYQSIQRDHISYFDYGKAKNYEIYNSAEPPEFPYYKINPDKLALISAFNDFISTQKDVQKFRNSLCKRPLVDHIIPDPDFNHLDYQVAIQAYEYFGRIVIQLIEQYVNGNQQYITSNSKVHQSVRLMNEL